MDNRNYKNNKFKELTSFVKVITLASLFVGIYKKSKNSDSKADTSKKDEMKDNKFSTYVDRFINLVEELLEEDEVEDKNKDEAKGFVKSKKTAKSRQTVKSKVKVVNLNVEERKRNHVKNEIKKTLTDRQSQIVDILKSKQHATMNEIKESIDSNLSERTLRRDLSTLTQLNLIEKSGNTKGAIYSLVV